MAVFDIGAITIGSIFCGSFSIRGEIFCTNPDLIYLVGCFQAGKYEIQHVTIITSWFQNFTKNQN